VPATLAPRSAMLMSDMPSPNNGHIIWHTYTDSNRGGRHGAMAEMLGPRGRMLKVSREEEEGLAALCVVGYDDDGGRLSRQRL
jgi:hypothetical protein